MHKSPIYRWSLGALLCYLGRRAAPWAQYRTKRLVALGDRIFELLHEHPQSPWVPALARTLTDIDRVLDSRGA